MLGLALFCLTVTAHAAAEWADTAAGFQGWSQIETRYTRIIFEDQDVEAALELVSFADRIFDEVTALLGYRPTELVPVIITDRTAFANGFYSAFPHRISLYVTSPSERFLGSRDESWLEILYLHELVHYVHMTAPYGLPGFLSHIFGPDLKAGNFPFMPTWWIEGIAVYAETAMTAGGRGDSAVFRQRYRAFILEEEMWHRYQMRYWSPFEPADRPYMGGYLFVDYLMRRFGQNVFADINRSFVRWPFFGIGFAIWRGTGESFGSLYEDMIADLELEFAEFDMSQERGQSLIPAARSNIHLPQPASGGWLGYEQGLYTGSTLTRYSSDFEVQERYTIGRLSDAASLSVHPDGEYAVFSTINGDPLHPGGTAHAAQSYSDLYRIDLHSAVITQLTSQQHLLQPSVSSDGRIVALSARGPYYVLVEVDTQNAAVREIYRTDNGSLYEPQIDSRGEFVTAVEIVRGHSSLVRIPLDGGEPDRLLPFSKAAIYRPRNMADGSILFSSDLNDSLVLYRYFEGTVTALLDDPVGVFGAQEAGDGLVYSVFRHKGYTLRGLQLEELDSRIVDWPEDEAPASAMAIVQESDVRIKNYRDMPLFGMWAPNIALKDSGRPDGIPHVLPGIYVSMASPLGRNHVSLSLLYNFAENQPDFDIQYLQQRSWGHTGYRAGSSYYPDGAFRDSFVSINTSRILGYRQFPGWSSDLSARGGLAGVMRVSTGPDHYYLVQPNIGIGYRRSRHAASAAMYGSDAYSASLDLAVPVEFFRDTFAYDLRPRAGLSLRRSLPWFLHVLQADADLAASLSGDMRAALLPRGGATWYLDTDLQAKLRTTLLYRMPLLVFDQWVPWGGVTGLGSSVYLQTAWYAGLTDDGPSFSWEQAMYAGTEMNLNWQLLSGQLRPVFGANFRIRPGEKFDPGLSGDIKLYFDIAF